ncbi:MAG: hypothetical protein KatS3mg111_2660 [Pirellulaceae bacterium]|nr:MAG: hypothetical protein KatS3mg111_2660 [Pirellulaceae bacterium]
MEQLTASNDCLTATNDSTTSSDSLTATNDFTATNDRLTATSDRLFEEAVEAFRQWRGARVGTRADSR